MVMADLVKIVSGKTGNTQVATRETIAALLDVVSQVMKDGDSITFQGFGTFLGVTKPERSCRSPHNGDTIVVPEHNAPVFKASKRLKDLCK